MGGGEGNMMMRMHIFGDVDFFEVDGVLELVDIREDGVGGGNGERASFTEIVLGIYDNERQALVFHVYLLSGFRTGNLVHLNRISTYCFLQAIMQ